MSPNGATSRLSAGLCLSQIHASALRIGRSELGGNQTELAKFGVAEGDSRTPGIENREPL